MKLKDSLIENGSIGVNLIAKDWKEAIKLTTDFLVKSGAIKEEYYKAIIDSTEEHGAYYIIAPEVAMPHARPECGVNKDSFSLVTLAKPVSFGEEYGDVSVLITLAATSVESHNDIALIQVADLFDDEEKIEKIKSAKSVEEILKYL